MNSFTGDDASTYPSRTLLLSLLGNHWQGRDPSPDGGRDLAADTRTFVDVLGRVGVAEPAVRATLNRAVKRGQLARHQQGRQAYFSVTPSTRRLLAEGAERLHHVPSVRVDWDGTWTLLAFSMPETRRADRHRLRTRLAWEGFGPLRDGLWLAPGDVDAGAMADALGVADDVHAFAGRAIAPSDVTAMVAEAWDLDGLAAGYAAFLARWDRPAPLPDAPDDLARWILLVTQWRLLVLEDPGLPARHLPADWPAAQARQVFDAWYEHFERTASPLFERALGALQPAEARAP